jgi:hypothetical protein
MATELQLATLYKITSNNNTFANKSQFNAVEIQGGTVNIYATLRDDAAVVGKSQMSLDIALAGDDTTGAIYPLNSCVHVYFETASGSPKIYASFSVMEA